MAGIMVPKSRAEAPTGGGNRLFPAGEYAGTIEEVRTRPFPDYVDPVSRPKGGYASSDGEILSIQLGENRALNNESADPGNQKMFVDFVIRDGDVAIDSGPNIDDRSWQMQRSATLLTNLALALGATSEVTGEDGDTYVVTVDNFLSELRDGNLNGTNVGFTTYHRPWEKKNEAGDVVKSGTDVHLSEFYETV